MKPSNEKLVTETFAFRILFAAFFVAAWVWMHYLLA
jgi:hypothetical protein